MDKKQRGIELEGKKEEKKRRNAGLSWGPDEESLCT